jgi:hypothetical protein
MQPDEAPGSTMNMSVEEVRQSLMNCVRDALDISLNEDFGELLLSSLYRHFSIMPMAKMTLIPLYIAALTRSPSRVYESELKNDMASTSRLYFGPMRSP